MLCAVLYFLSLLHSFWMAVWLSCEINLLAFPCGSVSLFCGFFPFSFCVVWVSFFFFNFFFFTTSFFFLFFLLFSCLILNYLFPYIWKLEILTTDVFFTITAHMKVISSRQWADMSRLVTQTRFMFRSLSLQVKGCYAHIFSCHYYRHTHTKGQFLSLCSFEAVRKVILPWFVVGQCPRVG